MTIYFYRDGSLRYYHFKYRIMALQFFVLAPSCICMLPKSIFVLPKSINSLYLCTSLKYLTPALHWGVGGHSFALLLTTLYGIALHCWKVACNALHYKEVLWIAPVLDWTALKGVGQERKWRYQKAGFDLTQLDNVKSSILIPASSFSGRKYQISRRGPPKLPKRWKRRSCWGQPPTEELNSRRGITNFICDP